MSSLRPLLDVQDRDLASDRLSERRRILPEREALEACLVRAAELDAEHAKRDDERGALSRAEHDLAAEVGGVAAKAKEVEDALYSGKVTVPKELEAQQEELRLLRERQAGFEEQEMELLEQIEGVDAAMAENRAARAAKDAEVDALRSAIAEAEAEIDSELATLAGQREERVAGLPSEILEKYDRLRTKDRLRGRAAVPLADDGVCGGCRVKLPRIEFGKMKAAPEDALISCPGCGRVLVR